MSDSLLFAKSEALTVGVELELQLIDPQTLDLTPASQSILNRIGEHNLVQPEIWQSMLEINSLPRKNILEVSADLKTALNEVKKAADAEGVEIACSGTHPTAKHWERKPFPDQRYTDLIDRNQFIARRLMIYGMHVHVGVENGDLCIALMNELLYELPLFLGLSASSPFWEGLDTGLASSRITFFESIPTGGHPYVVEDWTHFQKLVNTLSAAKAIRSLKDIWWDVRPSPRYGTLEIRICDGLPTLEENMAVAAFIHAVACDLYKNILLGKRRPILPDWMIRENKWRASRHGVNADLVVNEHGLNKTFRHIVEEKLTEIASAVKSYGYEKYLPALANKLDGYTSYERQRMAYEKEHNFKHVTQLLIDEMNSSLRRGT